MHISVHLANVAGRGETKSTDETRTHIRKNITVKVGHNHHSVCVWSGVLCDLQSHEFEESLFCVLATYLQADAVQKVFVVLDAGELFRNLTTRRQEHAVRHFPGLLFNNSRQTQREQRT